MSQSSLGGDGGATTLLGLTDTPSSWGTSGQVLKVNSGANGVEWAADNGGSGGISNVSEDTTPQLGGDLDVNGNSIVSASNGDIVLEPNGTGVISAEGTVKLATESTGASSSSNQLDFYGTNSGSTSVNQGRIRSSRWATNSNAGNLEFYTANTSNTPTLRMTLDGQGYCGLGTSSPSEKLHISGAGTQRLLIEETGSTVKTKLLSSTTAGVLATATDHPLGFDTNDQRRMTLTSTGLGIGTTSPSEKLHCNGHAIINNTLSGSGAYLKFNTLSTGGYINWQINGSEKMRLTAGGSVGIATSAPSSSHKLDVRGQAVFGNTDTSYQHRLVGGASSYSGFEIYNGSNKRAIVRTRGDSGNEALEIRSETVSGSTWPIKFVTGGSERARITSDGLKVNNGTLILGEADTSSGHLNAYESLTFNIDTDNDDTNRYFSFSYNGSSGSGTEVLRINESGMCGIGGTPSAERLEIINSGADAAPALRISNDAQSWNLATRGDVSDNFVIRDVTGGSNVFTLAAGTGNCGINTTSPNIGSWGKALTINSDSTASSCSLELAQGGTLYGFVGVQGSGSSNALDIAAYQLQAIRFRVGTNGGTHAMVLDSSGNCGIGATPSSSAKLHVYGSVAGTHKTLVENANSSGIVFTSHKGSGGYGCNVGYASTGWTDIPLLTDRGFVSAQSGTDGLVLNTEGSDPIIFGTNDTERMRIDSSGTLILSGDGGSITNSLDFSYNGTSGQGSINADSNSGNTHITLGTSSSGSLAERMRIDSSGNVGISTTQPTRKFDCVGYVSIQDTSAERQLLVANDSSDVRLYARNRSDNSDVPMVFHTGVTERMRITSAGRIIAKKASNAEVTALTDGATITPDLDDANNFSVTLGGNRTLANPSNCTAGQSGVITITQDGTGSRTLAYGGYWKFSGGTAPTLTTTASAVDVLAYYVESATRITATLITDTK